MADITGNLSVGQLNATLSSNGNNINTNINDNASSQSNINSNNIQQATIVNSNNIQIQNLQNANGLGIDFTGLPVSGYGYVYFCFADKLPTSNSEIYLTPKSTTNYMGVYSCEQPTQPMIYNLYKWVKIKGENGVDGADGETGEQGPKGDSGETTLIVVNPLHFKGYLQTDKWEKDESRDIGFYKQKINVTNTQLVSANLSQQELIDYMNIKMTDMVTPIVDLLVSTNIEIGLSQIEQWKYITRVYMSRERYINDEDEPYNEYFLIFECYRQVPTIQLPFQVEVV